MSIELKTASGGSVTLVPEDGVSNVTATVKHESGVLASEFDAGVGRTWQDVTASRSANVTYTNNTGRDIVVGVGLTVPQDQTLSVTVNGVVVNSLSRTSNANIRFPVSFTVPANGTYRIGDANSNVITWSELR